MKVLVIGASSGLGAELVRQLLARGDKVAGVARRSEAIPDGALRFSHDVREYGAVSGLLKNFVDQLGGLDMVIYAAGVMPEVGPEELDFEKDREMIETNLLGAMAWLNPIAERFAAEGRGTIVGIGSVAGDRGRSGKPGYAASKAGMATYLEALRNRLAKTGVKVVTIKPGPLDTPMTATHTVKKMPVDEAARRILALSSRAGENYLSPIHRFIFWGIRSTPGWLFRRIGPP